jgi:hypothetical protein
MRAWQWYVTHASVPYMNRASRGSIRRRQTHHEQQRQEDYPRRSDPFRDGPLGDGTAHRSGCSKRHGVAGWHVWNLVILVHTTEYGRAV